MKCISTTSVSVLVNGSPIEEFSMKRGLRQGDPLSPFLFLIAAKGLNIMMNSLVENNLYLDYGIRLHRQNPITHLQFANDTLLINDKS